MGIAFQGRSGLLSWVKDGLVHGKVVGPKPNLPNCLLRPCNKL